MEPKPDLKEVSLLGSLGYTPEKVCMIMGLETTSADEIKDNPASDLYAAYWAGFYETDIKVRKSVFDLAAKGSSPAQAEARRLLEQAETRRFYEQ